MAEIITQDVLFFFDGRPRELALYERLAEALLSRFPEAGVRVRKTQIGFYDGGLFACASLTPVRPKAQRPDRFITVTFGLDFPLEDPRALAVAVSSRRWTHHVILGSEADIDDTLLGWIAQSHAFTNRRKDKKKKCSN